MKTYFTLLMAFLVTALFAQEASIEGYIYESGNRGYLYDVSVTVENMESEKIIGKTKTDADGFFKVEVPPHTKVRLYAAKDMFDIKRLETEVATGKTFVKLEMGRAPGYTFEITLAEKRSHPNEVVDAISGSRIEVYNNTTRKSEMDLKDYDSPNFQLNLKKGNHYTLLIRKLGFLSKRIEVKVDVEGCILCFDGIGNVDPGVADNLTEGNAFGVLLANVELERIFEGKTMEIQNLYYALGKSYLTRSAKNELNKVITLMKDNPNLTIELGSHTDCRGNNSLNLELSNKRAQSAATYLIRNGGISKQRILSKGYGEMNPINDCVDGVECPEEEHAVNRRTELKIVGITNTSEFKSLAKMKEEEYLDEEILKLMDQKEIKAKDEEDLKRILAETAQEKNEQDDKSKKVENRNEIKSERQKLHHLEESYRQATDGIKVIVYQSQDTLPKSHFIHQRHRDIELFKNDLGRVCYMLGGFTNEQEAFEFLDTYIKPDKKYEKPMVVKIINGVLAVVNQ